MSVILEIFDHNFQNVEVFIGDCEGIFRKKTLSPSMCHLTLHGEMSNFVTRQLQISQKLVEMQDCD